MYKILPYLWRIELDVQGQVQSSYPVLKHPSISTFTFENMIQKDMYTLKSKIYREQD